MAQIKRQLCKLQLSAALVQWVACLTRTPISVGSIAGCVDLSLMTDNIMSKSIEILSFLEDLLGFLPISQYHLHIWNILIIINFVYFLGSEVKGQY